MLDTPDSPYTAIVIATAGLVRLNLKHCITTRLCDPEFLHAVGQGALGIFAFVFVSLSQEHTLRKPIVPDLGLVMKTLPSNQRFQLPPPNLSLGLVLVCLCCLNASTRDKRRLSLVVVERLL
jgi:Porphobilinogen deaminase, dipyromethane cofactor binding domain